MVDLNLSNFITVGIISVVAYVGLKAALKAANITPSWL